MSNEPESSTAERGSEVCSLAEAISRVTGNALRYAVVVFASLLTFAAPATARATSELAPAAKPKDPPVQTPSENSVKFKDPTDELEGQRDLRDLDSQLANMGFRTAPAAKDAYDILVAAKYATELRRVLGKSMEEMAPFMGAIKGSGMARTIRSVADALGLMPADSAARNVKIENLFKKDETIARVIKIQDMISDMPAQNQSYARAMINAINLDVTFRMFIERMKRNDIDTPAVPGNLIKYAENIYAAYQEAYQEKGEDRARKLKQIELFFRPEHIWSAATGQ